MDRLLNNLDLHSVREVGLAGRAECDEIALVQPAGNLSARKVDDRIRCNLHGRAHQLVIDDLVDEVDGTFGVERFARYAEHVVTLGSRDPDCDIGIRQQVAARIVDGDEAFTDVARAVGDDGRGRLLDVTVPDEVRLGLPGNGDGLAGGKLADLRLVEVGTNLQLGEVGNVDERLAGLHEVILRNRQRVDVSGEGSVYIHVGIPALRGGQICPSLR